MGKLEQNSIPVQMTQMQKLATEAKMFFAKGCKHIYFCGKIEYFNMAMSVD